MTLRGLYEALEEVSLSVPDVLTFIPNDITRLNEMRNVKYGVVGVTQNQHSCDREFMRYSLNIFYVDRLLNSGDNEVEIQSHAISVLHQIVLAMEEYASAGEEQYNVFTQRFQDLCAGAWVTVTFSVPVSECVEI